jgi:hypothetical protein
LLPFYPSRGRDDGYDIADYHNVHAGFGEMADFRSFVDEAHRCWPGCSSGFPMRCCDRTNGPTQP